MPDAPSPAPSDVPAPPSSDGRRRRRRANETVPARDAELVRIAAEMFRRRGYDATSVADLAAAFGITKGSVYHYIDSKEDLLFRICKAAHDDARPIIEAVEQMEGTARARLEHFLRETAASNARNVANIAVYYRELGRLTGDRKATIFLERRRYEELLVRLIEEGKQAGEIDPSIPTRVVSANLLAQVVWLYTWYREEAGPTPDDLGRAVARLALDGVAPPRRGARRR